jgi:flagellar biosynthesis/type III secretory pathway M-ring protein FliF/YscJ
MDGEIPLITEVPVKTCVFKNPYTIAIIIVLLAVFAGVALLLFLVYVKFFKKNVKADKEEGRKKKQKCDHKKTEEAPTVSVEDKVKNLDALLSNISQEEKKELEREDQERVLSSTPSTGDVVVVDESTSFEE